MIFTCWFAANKDYLLSIVAAPFVMMKN